VLKLHCKVVLDRVVCARLRVAQICLHERLSARLRVPLLASFCKAMLSIGFYVLALNLSALFNVLQFCRLWRHWNVRANKF